MSHQELAWSRSLLKPKIRTQRRPEEQALSCDGEQELEKGHGASWSRSGQEVCGFSEKGDPMQSSGAPAGFPGSSRVSVALASPGSRTLLREPP